MGFHVEGAPPPEPGQVPSAVYRVALPGYFRTMGIGLLAGRDFTARHTESSPGVVIINETLARRNWPQENPLGNRIRTGSDEPWLSIVGVIGDVKQSDWTGEAASEIYLPYLQQARYRRSTTAQYGYLTLVVRATTDAEDLAHAIEREVWSVDRNLPVSRVGTMEQVIAENTWRPRFALVLMGIFAGLAVVLAAVGIYGVTSYAVSRRTREIGVRMALGARPADVLRLVAGQALWSVLIGLAAGVAGAFAVTRALASLMFGVSSTDPATFAAAILVLVAVAALACCFPARRAARVDPMAALRHE